MYLQPHQKLQHTLKQQQQQQQQQLFLLLHFNLHFAIAENLDLTNPFQFAFCNREWIRIWRVLVSIWHFAREEKLFLTKFLCEWSCISISFSKNWETLNPCSTRSTAREDCLIEGFVVWSVFAYLPSIMTVACGLVPGEKLKVEPSMTRRASTPNTW